MSKLKIAGVFLLSVCLSALYALPVAEAAKNPEAIIANLQVRLNSILSDATRRRNELSGKVTPMVNKFNTGKISHDKLCTELDEFQESSNDARDKYNKKITKAVKVTKKQLQNVGADPSYTITAEDMEDDTATDKESLYDDLDTAIDNAKKVTSPWCT